MLTRRAVFGTAAWLTLTGGRPVKSDGTVAVRVENTGPGRPISPYVYGSNELGRMEGGELSSLADRRAGVTARRLGGNLLTTFNWTRNVANAGKDWHHENTYSLPYFLGLSEADRVRPGAVIEAVHATSLSMGATSLITLPLAGYVAADAEGVVTVGQTAPSSRFVPVRWASDRRAADPVDETVADIPHLLRRLRAKFGPADGPTGIRGYALDNEPDLWPETHPRVVPVPWRIADLITRSIAAARAIKAIDPAAWVFGPVSWGATGMVTFQNAPDWPAYRHYGCFLAAYLDAFRKASEADGRRLLDALDIHWYPFSDRGTLYRCEDPALAEPLLDAPRSLDEAGFHEGSWVERAFSDAGELGFPLLPSLARLAARWYPDTPVAFTEFNYGGAGQLASGLALADVLGRFGRNGVLLAAHWGNLGGWLGQAHRLYRNYDGAGGAFGGRALETQVSDPHRISVFAAAGERGRLHLIVLNKAAEPVPVALALAHPASGPARCYGFDAAQPATGPVAAAAGSVAAKRFVLPPRSARHWVVEGGVA